MVARRTFATIPLREGLGKEGPQSPTFRAAIVELYSLYGPKGLGDAVEAVRDMHTAPEGYAAIAEFLVECVSPGAVRKYMAREECDPRLRMIADVIHKECDEADAWERMAAAREALRISEIANELTGAIDQDPALIHSIIAAVCPKEPE